MYNSNVIVLYVCVTNARLLLLNEDDDDDVSACVDVGLTVSERYSINVHRQHLTESSSPAKRTTSVGYVAHLMGAVAGLAAGFIVLRRSTTSPRPTSDCDQRLHWRRRRRMDVIWSAVANVCVP